MPDIMSRRRFHIAVRLVTLLLFDILFRAFAPVFSLPPVLRFCQHADAMLMLDILAPRDVAMPLRAAFSPHDAMLSRFFTCLRAAHAAPCRHADTPAMPLLLLAHITLTRRWLLIS